MEDDFEGKPEEDKTLRNDKGERVDELDLMGAAIFLSIQNLFRKIFPKKKTGEQ
jgi:hypothetical protein